MFISTCCYSELETEFFFSHILFFYRKNKLLLSSTSVSLTQGNDFYQLEFVYKITAKLEFSQKLFCKLILQRRAV